jgi:hypothetical protein
MPGQEETDEFIKLSTFTARPYPNTSLTIKFPDGRIKECKAIRDSDAEPGAQNIMVEYGDGTTQRFTSSDDIDVKINGVTAHYRGGKKRKTRRNKKTRKSRKRKSRRRKSRNM